MERIGKRLQKSGKRALSPLVRKLWQEQNGTAIYRYTCMLDFFDDAGWLDQLVKITLQRKDLEEDGKLALLDLLHDCGIDVTAPPFAGMTGYGAASLDGFIDECLSDGERGLVRFIDSFLDVADEYRERMIRRLSEVGTPDAVALLEILLSFERPEVVREAILALGRIKNGCALNVLERAEPRHEGDIAEPDPPQHPPPLLPGYPRAVGASPDLCHAAAVPRGAGRADRFLRRPLALVLMEARGGRLCRYAGADRRVGRPAERHQLPHAGREGIRRTSSRM